MNLKYLKILSNYTNAEKDFMKAFKFLRINKIKGSYIEFGVYRGDSMATAFKCAKLSRYKFLHYIGYDSFTGLNIPKGVDIKHLWKGGEFKDTSMKLVQKKLNKFKVPFVLIKGQYEITLNKYTLECPTKLKNKIACVHIDCDYYSSTKLALNFITEYLQNGSIIIFNDWYCFKASDNLGERKAFIEWKRKNKQFQYEDLPSYDLQKIIIIKKKDE